MILERICIGSPLKVSGGFPACFREFREVSGGFPECFREFLRGAGGSLGAPESFWRGSSMGFVVSEMISIGLHDVGEDFQ
jgi:hypothetical protein